MGQTVRTNFDVSDDLEHWDGMDRVHEVLLRIRVVGYTEENVLQFTLNGNSLQVTREINKMYMMSSPRYRIGGQWFIFKLDKINWPKQGKNILETTLTYVDPDILGDCSVRDIELDIKYLRGKNFERGGLVDTDVGPYEISTT